MSCNLLGLCKACTFTNASFSNERRRTLFPPDDPLLPVKTWHWWLHEAWYISAEAVSDVSSSHGSPASSLWQHESFLSQSQTTIRRKQICQITILYYLLKGKSGVSMWSQGRAIAQLKNKYQNSGPACLLSLYGLLWFSILSPSLSG